MARREAAMRLLARALVLRRAPAHEWSPDDRITLDAFLRTPTGGRFYDALALLAVTAALRVVEERPFEAGGTAGMGRVVREIDGMGGGWLACACPVSTRPLLAVFNCRLESCTVNDDDADNIGLHNERNSFVSVTQLFPSAFACYADRAVGELSVLESLGTG
jgi:hypothetical protein